MLQARVNLIAADPLRLGDLITFIVAEVQPAVERLPGSLGMTLAVDRRADEAVLLAALEKARPGPGHLARRRLHTHDPRPG